MLVKIVFSMQFFYIFSFFPNHDCKDIRNFNTKQLFESELPPTRFSMSPNHLINYFTSTYTSTLYSSSNLGKVLSVRLYTQNFAFYHQMQTPHLSIMPTLFYLFTLLLFYLFHVFRRSHPLHPSECTEEARLLKATFFA